MAKYILPGNFIIANPRYGINIYTSHGEGVFKSFDNFSFYGTNGTYDHNHPCFITDDDTVEFKQNNEDLTDFKFKEFDFPEHDFTYGRLEEATADNIEKREVKYKGIISQIGGCATEVINITAPSLSVWVVCVPDISYLFKVSNYLPENLFSNTDYLFPGAFYNSNLKSTDKKSFFYCTLIDNSPTLVPIDTDKLSEQVKSNPFYAFLCSKEGVEEYSEYRPFSPSQEVIDKWAGNNSKGDLISWHISCF